MLKAALGLPAALVPNLLDECVVHAGVRPRERLLGLMPGLLILSHAHNGAALRPQRQHSRQRSVGLVGQGTVGLVGLVERGVWWD